MLYTSSWENGLAFSLFKTVISLTSYNNHHFHEANEFVYTILSSNQ